MMEWICKYLFWAILAVYKDNCAAYELSKKNWFYKKKCTKILLGVYSGAKGGGNGKVIENGFGWENGVDKMKVEGKKGKL